LAVPVEQKISDGWDRVIMRRAMENILPKEIQLRPTKTSLGLNFHKNLLSFEKPLFEDIIFNQNHLIKDYVDVDFLQEIYEEYSSHNGRVH
jgi:asparagine synthase (glutamine-hydrolysing)